MSPLRNFFIYTIFIAFILFFSPAVAGAADRYWVGGTGNWSDDDNHWAATSGGAPADGNLPTANDDVFFDTNSHTTNYIVTVDATANVLSITTTAPSSGNLTMTGASTLDVYGNLSFYTGMVFTKTGTLGMRSTSTGRTFNSGGTVLGTSSAYILSFNGTGGGWTLLGNVNCGQFNMATSSILDMDGFTITPSSSVSLSGTSTLDLTASTLTALSANITFAALTTIMTDAGTVISIGGGNGYSLGAHSFNGAFNVSLNSSPAFDGGNTFNDLTITGDAQKTRSIPFSGNNTITGTLTVNGNSSINRVIIQSSVKGTARTLTAANVSFSNVDFQDITGAGAGNWNLSAITGLSGDAGGNSGITFTPAQTNYWIGGTGNWDAVAEWANVSGGAGSSGRVPLPQDDVRFDANSFTAGSQTVTTNMPRLGRNIDWTGVTNTPAWSNVSAVNSIFGSVTLVSGMTATGGVGRTLEGRGSFTLTTAGKTWANTWTIDAPGGIYTLQDTFTSSTTLTLMKGEFDANDFNVTVEAMQDSGSAARTLRMGSGTWTITGNTTNLWFLATTGLTFFSEASTIRLTGTLTAARNFVGGTQTYYNLINETTGAFAVHVLGSNTFNNIHIDASVAARTLKFTAGTTTTVASMTRDVGTNVITLDSITTGAHTLTKTGGGTISLDYLNIQHSIATPSNTWYAGLNSTDNQAVVTAGSGWLFTDFPPDDPTALGPTDYVNGSSNTDTAPTFTFTLSDQNVADTVQYRIQIDDTSDFSTPLVDYTSALAAQGAGTFTVGQAQGTGTYTVGVEAQTLTDGSYYWRVQAIDQATAESSYSTANSGGVAFIVYTPSSSSGSRRNPTPATTVVTTPTQPVTNLLVCVIATPLLKLSSRGTDVSCLQQKLNILIPTNLVTDGIFGPLTKQAVINFQTKNDLVPDGIVGPLTRGVLK